LEVFWVHEQFCLTFSCIYILFIGEEETQQQTYVAANAEQQWRNIERKGKKMENSSYSPILFLLLYVNFFFSQRIRQTLLKYSVTVMAFHMRRKSW